MSNIQFFGSISGLGNETSLFTNGILQLSLYQKKMAIISGIALGIFAALCCLYRLFIHSQKPIPHPVKPISSLQNINEESHLKALKKIEQREEILNYQKKVSWENLFKLENEIKAIQEKLD